MTSMLPAALLGAPSDPSETLTAPALVLGWAHLACMTVRQVMSAGDG